MKMKVGGAGNSRALFIFDLLPCLPKPSLAFYGAGLEIFAAKKRLKQDIDLDIMDFRLDTRGYQPPLLGVSDLACGGGDHGFE